ncbi:MAG: hypothetical protein AAGH15_28350 [Myxococcota bacterium]
MKPTDPTTTCSDVRMARTQAYGSVGFVGVVRVAFRVRIHRDPTSPALLPLPLI